MNQELKNSRKSLAEFWLAKEDENDWGALTLRDICVWVKDNYPRKYEQIENRQWQDVSRVLALKKDELFTLVGETPRRGVTKAQLLEKYFRDGGNFADSDMISFFKMTKKDLLRLCLDNSIGTDGKEKNAELQTYMMEEWYCIGYALYSLKDWIVNDELTFDDLVESKRADRWYAGNCKVRLIARFE